jgi:hypothetical protein
VLTGIWDNGNTAISRGALQSSLNSQTVLGETAISTGNGYTNNAWPAGTVRLGHWSWLLC